VSRTGSKSLLQVDCRTLSWAQHVYLAEWLARILQSFIALLQLVDGALSELSGLLALAGLPVTLTPQYARPVAGFTLEVGPAAAACSMFALSTCCLPFHWSVFKHTLTRSSKPTACHPPEWVNTA
jgi:hypothetical protein